MQRSLVRNPNATDTLSWGVKMPFNDGNHRNGARISHEGIQNAAYLIKNPRYNLADETTQRSGIRKQSLYKDGDNHILKLSKN